MSEQLSADTIVNLAKDIAFKLLDEADEAVGGGKGGGNVNIDNSTQINNETNIDNSMEINNSTEINADIDINQSVEIGGDFCGEISMDNNIDMDFSYGMGM